MDLFLTIRKNLYLTREYFAWGDLQKALSRKGSCRMERRIGEEQETDDASKKIIVKGKSSFFFPSKYCFS